MPIFEYKCKKCGEKFDHLLLSATQAPPVCPKCGTKDPVKQISAFSTSRPSGASGASGASRSSTFSAPT